MKKDVFRLFRQGFDFKSETGSKNMRNPICILLVVLIYSSCSFNYENEQYSYYLTNLKNYGQISLSVPHKHVEYDDASKSDIFMFGPMLPEFRTGPIFETGPVLNLTKDCSVVLMNVSNNNPLKPRSLNLYSPYVLPTADGWMLCNCKVPWANWYITNTGGIILSEAEKQKNSGFKELTEKERVELQEQVSELRSKYEYSIENSELNELTGCDKIFVVNIPNVDLISCTNETIETEIIDNSKECYAVEFYRSSRAVGLTTLFFIKGDKSIDDYVKLFGKYVKFE